MARYYRKKRFYKGNSNTLSSAGNQLAKDNAKAKRNISKGSFF